MADLVEGLEDWAANKFLIAPALQILVNNGTLTLAADKNIEQAADELLNAITETAAKKVAAQPRPS
jgi:hypothetical protein